MYYKLAYNDRLSAPKWLIAGTVLMSFLVILVFFSKFQNSQTLILGKDKSGIVRLDVVNVTSNSISVFWRTTSAVTPTIWYSKENGKLGARVYDVRDTEHNQIPRRNHLVTIDNVSPATQYYFRIGGVLGNKNNEYKFTAKTASATNASASHPIYGKLVDTQNTGLSDLLVMIKIDDSFPLATFTKQDGTFLISTCCVVNSKTYTSGIVEDTTPIVAEIISEDGKNLIIDDYIGQASPFESPIILVSGSKRINNRAKDSKAQKVADVPLILGVSSELQKSADKDFGIIYPAQNSIIPLGSPLLKGTGLPNSSVKLSLKGTEFVTSTSVGDDGLWRAQFARRIQAGSYELIAELRESNGNKKVITRNFVITKSGEQVLGSATDSATITPSITPTTSAILSPTPTIYLVPTSQVVPTTTRVVTSSPPVSGGVELESFSLVSIALIIVGAGIILIF